MKCDYTEGDYTEVRVYCVDQKKFEIFLNLPFYYKKKSLLI
jgi:hypothetical protein